MSINTLVIANRLKTAEREGRTAEEIALVLQEIQDGRLAEVATKEFVHGEVERLRLEIRGEIRDLREELKGDIADLRIELKGDIASVRGEIAQLRADMEKMETRIMHAMTLRLGAMIAAGVAVLGSINVFF